MILTPILWAKSPQEFKKAQDIMKMEGCLARLINNFENLGPEFMVPYAGVKVSTFSELLQLLGYY